jgi:flagellar biosynthesis GTPase FlhF
VKVAKERCEGDVKALKEKNEEEIARLSKKYEEQLAIAQRDRESAVKAMNVTQNSLNAKDERIKALAKDNEAAFAELSSLRKEKAKWESDKDILEATIGEQFEEGFKLALDQVKVLFPDIDRDHLEKADAMLVVEGDKLVPSAPEHVVQDTPDVEVSPKASPDEESPVAG